MELDHCQTVSEFKVLIEEMQELRRKVVRSFITRDQQSYEESSYEALDERVQRLKKTLEVLKDSLTSASYLRKMTAGSQTFSINIKDEIDGLTKDMELLQRLHPLLVDGSEHTVEELLVEIDLPAILADYHPISKEQFYVEVDHTVEFLQELIKEEDGLKPVFITDWDGTMKNYCSQYATNVQPIYSAIGMAYFAQKFTRLTAVLTAGPLKGPGILDLTSLPIDGAIIFSGSWGREWRLHGKRVAYKEGISEEGEDALERFHDEMETLLSSSEYSQFGLVGSGVQKKVDRLTLGVQTVCGHVDKELSDRYQEAVKERIHRVDPACEILVFDRSTDLEVEVCLHSSGSVWNKGDGVARLMDVTNQSLQKGRVLIAGDTMSDIPMIAYALKENPEVCGVAVVIAHYGSIRWTQYEFAKNSLRYGADVFHAALARFIIATESPAQSEERELDGELG